MLYLVECLRQCDTKGAAWTPAASFTCGFEWFMDGDCPEAWIEKHQMRDLTLGVARVKIDGGATMTNDEITDEIDARLPELERDLGYVAS
jgi:hypothetical protein